MSKLRSKEYQKLIDKYYKIRLKGNRHRFMCYVVGHDKIFPHPNKSMWFCARCEIDRSRWF